MNPKLLINFDKGYLRTLNTQDIHQKYISGLNDPLINRYLEVRHQQQSEQSVYRFVEANMRASDAVLFGIWLGDQKNHCGTLRIHGIDLIKRSAHIGICIFDRKAHGQGVGTKSIVASTNWVFKELRLNCLEAGAYQENIASQKAFMKAGYNWVYDIPGKYELDGHPETVKVYEAHPKP